MIRIYIFLAFLVLPSLLQARIELVHLKNTHNLVKRGYGPYSLVSAYMAKDVYLNRMRLWGQTDANVLPEARDPIAKLIQLLYPHLKGPDIVDGATTQFTPKQIGHIVNHLVETKHDGKMPNREILTTIGMPSELINPLLDAVNFYDAHKIYPHYVIEQAFLGLLFRVARNREDIVLCLSCMPKIVETTRLSLSLNDIFTDKNVQEAYDKVLEKPNRLIAYPELALLMKLRHETSPEADDEQAQDDSDDSSENADIALDYEVPGFMNQSDLQSYLATPQGALTYLFLLQQGIDLAAKKMRLCAYEEILIQNPELIPPFLFSTMGTDDLYGIICLQCLSSPAHRELIPYCEAILGANMAGEMPIKKLIALAEANFCFPDSFLKKVAPAQKLANVLEKCQEKINKERQKGENMSAYIIAAAQVPTQSIIENGMFLCLTKFLQGGLVNNEAFHDLVRLPDIRKYLVKKLDNFFVLYFNSDLWLLALRNFDVTWRLDLHGDKLAEYKKNEYRHYLQFFVEQMAPHFQGMKKNYVLSRNHAEFMRTLTYLETSQDPHLEGYRTGKLRKEAVAILKSWMGAGLVITGKIPNK